MKTWQILVLLVLFINIVAAEPFIPEPHVLSADEHISSPIRGTVRNEGGYGIYGVTVIAEDENSGALYLTHTDPTGRYVLDIPTKRTYNFTFEYNGRIVTDKQYVEHGEWISATIRPSFETSGSHNWTWLKNSYTKVASNDFALSRCYTNNVQLFKSLKTVSLMDTGLNAANGYRALGSRITNIEQVNGFTQFKTNNAMMRVHDNENGLFVAQYFNDSITEIWLPERYKILDNEDLDTAGNIPKIVRTTDGANEVVFLIYGDGKFSSKQYTITALNNEDSVLIAMPDMEGAVFSDMIDDILYCNIGGIIEVSKIENNVSCVPILLNRDYSIKSLSTGLDDNLEFNVSTNGEKKISWLVRFKSGDFSDVTITVDGTDVKKVKTHEQVLSLSNIVKTWSRSENGFQYFYVVFPDNQPHNVKIQYQNTSESNQVVDESVSFNEYEPGVLITSDDIENAAQMQAEQEKNDRTIPGFEFVMGVLVVIIAGVTKRRRWV